MRWLKTFFLWWLEGWRLLFYYSAMYILANILVLGPIAFVSSIGWWEIINETGRITITILYFGFYLPIVVKLTARYLRGERQHR